MATQLNNWLSIDKTSGTGNAEITLTASSYEELVDRATSLKIQGISANAILNVRQNALVPTITLSNSHFFFDYNGGNYLNTTITSNVDWVVNSSDNWFNVSHDYGTKGETVFRVEVTKNEGNKRDGTITFSYNGEVLATLYITQYGLISFVNDTMSFGYLAETQQNEILIDSPWYIVKDGDWFTVVPSNGSGVSNITVSVEENKGGRRLGSISLYTTDGDIYLGSITVKQASEFDSQYLWLETIETDKYVATGQKSIKFSFDGINWAEGNHINMNGNKIVYMYSDPPTDDLSLGLSSILGLNYISYGGKHSVGGNAAAIGKNVSGLFQNDVDLVDASELNISEIKKGGYMFNGCTNLKYPPKTLPTTITNDFNHMFSDCTSLLVAPQLPALELHNNKPYNGNNCLYGNMFLNCISLTTPPELPATVLGEGCYSGMFWGCTSLTTPPELPATVLKQFCYAGMFRECTSLTTAPVLPATTLVRACYKNMFSECSSLVKAPQLPATALAYECYSGMFYSCGSLVNPPQLPATTLAEDCYYQMFYWCTNLTTAPDLLAYSVPTSAYGSMFRNCYKLNYIKMLGVDISNLGLDDWVYGVRTTEGTFIKHPDANLPNGDSGIPNGWTVETATS